MQRRPGLLDLEELLKRVAKAYRVEVGDLMRPTYRPGEARQVGLYVARRVVGLVLKEIARRFGLGYTGVSRRVSAVEERLVEDVPFRKRVEAIINAKVKT